MQNRLAFLDAFLIQHQTLWRFEPFQLSRHPAYPWQGSHHELCQWLDRLSFPEVDALLASEADLLRHLAPYIQDLQQAAKYTEFATIHSALPALSSVLDNGIPGRKLSQIQALSAHALSSSFGDSWLEWCAGKGFLGRQLCVHSLKPVLSLEYQQGLCDAGETLVNTLGITGQQFQQIDVLSEEVDAFVQPSQHAVALHACGDLHQTLLRKVVERGLVATTISPCCYHLTASESYQPLSGYGQASSLNLTRQELRIPLQQIVTGGERVKRHRQQEMIFRLGFDELLRAELGYQQYLPIPSIKKSLLSQGFEAFCRWAAEQKDLTLRNQQFEHYQQLGQQRFERMEKLSLVQSAFKRILEVWLVLDKALYLQEHGYQVAVNVFCSREVTPRNLVIQATKPSE
ncbi:SAM-dependent methyltransferase [Vibrio sp. AK197]